MDDDDRTRLGQEIATSRERRGLSIRAAAEKAGISEGRLRQIQLGYESRGEHRLPTNPSQKTLRGIARALEPHVGPLLMEAAGLPVRPSDDPSAFVADRGPDDRSPGISDEELLDRVQRARAEFDELERLIRERSVDGTT